MFPKVSKRPGGVAVQIAESYRNEDGKPRHRTIRHVGSVAHGDDRGLEELKRQADAICARMRLRDRPAALAPDTMADMAVHARQQRARRRRVPCPDLTQLQPEQSAVVGLREVFGDLFREVGLDRLFSSRHQMARRLFREEVLSRLAVSGRPGLCHAPAWDPGPDATEAAVEKLCRMMDQLDQPLQRRLQDRVGSACQGLLGEVTVLFHDCATLCFESREADGPRGDGRGKDGKPRCIQATLAVTVAQGGVPVGYRLHAGNTGEAGAPRPVLRDVRRQHGNARVAMVADAGLLSQANPGWLEAKEHDYVVEARLRALPPALLEQVWDLGRHGPADGDEPRLLDIMWEGRRLIVRHDPARARKDGHDREAAAERAEESVRADVVAPGAHLAANDTESARPDQDAAGRDARLDGMRGVWTSLADLSAEEVWRRHADLGAIEDGFPAPGHGLAARPAFRWTEPRVHAHVAICFAAFALLRILVHRVRVQKAWAGPVSEQGILDALRAVTVNTVVDPGTKRRLMIPSRPTALQRAIYQTVGLRLPATCDLLEMAESPP